MLCGVDFDLIEPKELRRSLTKIARRLQRAARLPGIRTNKPLRTGK
jgi:hypothetical protein